LLTIMPTNSTGQQVTGARATFMMDAVGNITAKSQEGTSPQTMVYNAAQRITTMQQGTTRTTYTHDNNGNMTVEQVGTARTTSTYDRENRMTLQQIGAARTTPNRNPSHPQRYHPHHARSKLEFDVGEEPDRIKRGQELRSNPGNVGKVDAGIVPIYLPIEKWGLRN
jgi:hypothetical protein